MPQYPFLTDPPLSCILLARIYLPAIPRQHDSDALLACLVWAPRCFTSGKFDQPAREIDTYPAQLKRGIAFQKRQELEEELGEVVSCHAVEHGSGKRISQREIVLIELFTST